MRTINFDMDGTFVDFYGVDGWLDYLMDSDTTPYAIAKPLFDMVAFAKEINRLQSIGYKVNIISWLSKSGSDEYNQRVTETKKAWLRKYLPTVTFDNISIVKYGTPKVFFGQGILFDDEIGNRKTWSLENNNLAFDVQNIIEILKSCV